MDLSSKFSCTGRVEGLPTAVSALETVADQVSAVLAAALPSEHHRLASGHADTRWAAVEVPRVEMSKIWLGRSLRTRLVDNFAHTSDVSRRTQRRGAPLLAALCRKSQVACWQSWCDHEDYTKITKITKTVRSRHLRRAPGPSASSGR